MNTVVGITLADKTMTWIDPIFSSAVDCQTMTDRGHAVSLIFRPFFLLCFLVLFASGALTNAARADKPSNADTADATMQVFVAIADLAGAPIPKEVVPVVQGMVSCALNGTSLGDCAKNIAISTALSEVGKVGGVNMKIPGGISDAVSCLTSGNSAQTCLTNAAVSQLPAQAQPLANCIGNGGNVADCAEKAALTVATQQLGANLPPDVADTVKCVIGGDKLTTCAKSLVTKEIDQALKAANITGPAKDAIDGMVGCATGGSGKAADCVKNLAINSIPAGPAKDMATCLNAPGANAQTCVANFAAKNISDPTASAVVGCMGQTSGDKVQQCIANNAKQALGDAASQAEQQALVTAANAIANLQLDSPIQDPPKFPEQPAILQNIMSVADGIQQGNWALVVKGVGPEAAEVAGKIILSIFLTPALANVLSPVVDAMIQNDVNAFTNGVADLGKGDAVGVAEDIFKWYETQYIQAPCALMPDGAFRNSVCNGLADAINWVASEGGNLAKDILGLGKGILQDLGLWNITDDVATFLWDGLTSVIDDIGDFLGLGHKAANIICQNFPSPSDYFANDVVNSCLSAATSKAAASTPASMNATDVSAVVGKCKDLYNLCAGKDPAKLAAVETNCGKMGSALNQLAGTTAGGLRQAASSYAQSGVAIFAAKKYAQYKKNGNPEDICSASFWSDNLGEFAAGCAAAVGAHLQLPAGTNACPVIPTYDAATQACITAVDNASYLTNAVTGSNGSLCKRFYQDALKNPCQFTDKTTIVLPSGQVIASHLECKLVRPSWWGQLDPFQISLRPPRPFGGLSGASVRPSVFLPLPASFGSANSSGIFIPGLIWRRNPDQPAFGGWAVPSGSGSKGGGSKGGGTNTIATRPNPTAPFTRPAPLGGGHGPVLPQSTIANLPRPRLIPVAPGGGSGGFNTSRGGNSAMDNLSALNTGGGIGGVAGNSGGFADQRRRPSLPLGGPVVGSAPKGGGSGGINTVNGASGNAPTTKGGGSGGFNTVNGSSGNAPTTKGGGSGGINMVNGQSGNAPTSGNFRPINKLRVRPTSPSIDPLIEYGGCSSCGKPVDDLHVR